MTSRRWCRRHTRSASGTIVQTSNPQTYLTSTATGTPTFGGACRVRQQQIHLGSDPSEQRRVAQERHQGRLSISIFRHRATIICRTSCSTRSRWRRPASATPQNGKITRNDGTNWQNVDAKGIWRPYGYDGPQEISFGIHGDRYHLENPVYASTVWNATPSTGTGQLYSDGMGETRTGALWVQDAWKIVPT